MALPSTIFRVSLQLADLDRNLYESLQTTVAQHPSETEERLVARLLAYALSYEPGLAFTRGVGAADEPDLWTKGPDGRVLLWIGYVISLGAVIVAIGGTSLVEYDRRALGKAEGTVQTLASIEGLTAHARSAAIRLSR